MKREIGQPASGSRRRVGTHADERRSTRRALLIALGAGALAAPLAAFAQQQSGKVFRLGWLSAAGQRTEAYTVAFFARLREIGFSEGNNLLVEFRNAEGKVERLPELAADLARQNCDVFVSSGSEVILNAIRQVSRDTPIVMVANDFDPLASGHIASLARPGGNITGVSQFQDELPAKRLHLLTELLPKAKRIAVFSDTQTATQFRVVRAAARKLGITLHVVDFERPPYDYESGFADAVRAKAEALLVLASALFVPGRRRIPELALKNRLPSIFGNSLWAESGGLLSYGPNFQDFYRIAAEQVARILKGAKASELPVQQPTRFEMAINMKTAKALGIKIPNTILVRADKVIE
jgi:putative ABC transport system substrate-binding protein